MPIGAPRRALPSRLAPPARAAAELQCGAGAPGAVAGAPARPRPFWPRLLRGVAGVACPGTRLSFRARDPSRPRGPRLAARSNPGLRALAGTWRATSWAGRCRMAGLRPAGCSGWRRSTLTATRCPGRCRRPGRRACRRCPGSAPTRTGFRVRAPAPPSAALRGAARSRPCAGVHAVSRRRPFQGGPEGVRPCALQERTCALRDGVHACLGARRARAGRAAAAQQTRPGRVRRACAGRAGQLPPGWGSPLAMQALSALLLAGNNFSGTLPISCAPPRPRPHSSLRWFYWPAPRLPPRSARRCPRPRRARCGVPRRRAAGEG